jgi:hypothetical protein
MIQPPKPSVLRGWRVRSLPVALAHRLAKVRGDDPYMVTLNRLYAALPASDQSTCKAEMARYDA